MPSVSKKQHNFMAAVANNPKFAKKAGVPKSVGEDFMEADKGKKFRSGGLSSKKAGINKPRTNHGNIQMPNYSLLKYVGKKEGGFLINKEKKGNEMKKMNPGMMAIMAKKKSMKKEMPMEDKMPMKKGGMPMVMKDGKKVPAFAADGKGKMAKGGGIEVKGKTKGTMIKMKSGGKAC